MTLDDLPGNFRRPTVW